MPLNFSQDNLTLTRARALQWTINYAGGWSHVKSDAIFGISVKFCYCNMCHNPVLTCFANNWSQLVPGQSQAIIDARFGLGMKFWYYEVCLNP